MPIGTKCACGGSYDFFNPKQSEELGMNSLSAMWIRLSEVARTDSDTLATAVLTGLMAFLALMVLV